MFELSESDHEIYYQYAGLSLPRHTSYPCVPHWEKGACGSLLKAKFQEHSDKGEAFALYVHVPFCEKLCFYCACYKEITPKNSLYFEKTREYLLSVEAELDLLTKDLKRKPVFSELHLGGGSPTYLEAAELKALMNIIFKYFDRSGEASISIEIDPRGTTKTQIDMLFELGFNRYSLGVQDFDVKVQRAINRFQSFSQVEGLVSLIRERSSASINFDLIYGLPFQSVESIENTLDLVIKLNPDRLACFHLALIPEIFKWQRSFARIDLPDACTTLAIFLTIINKLRHARYDFIGLDHFAKKSDPLKIAYESGDLQRNFHGMTTGKSLPVLGIGPSAISTFEDFYSQNEHKSSVWREKLSFSELPSIKGISLSQNELIRKDVIQALYSHQVVFCAAIESKYKIEFWEYFSSEKTALEELQTQEICEVSKTQLKLSPFLGRLLVRVVAAVFDDFLPQGAYKSGLCSKAASKIG